MPCDTRLRRGQTISQRKLEVKETVEAIARAIIDKKIGLRIGPQGSIAFNIPENERNNLTDACVYRQIKKLNSPAIRAAIEKAELLAGRKLEPHKILAGIHSHDGGQTWHNGH